MHVGVINSANLKRLFQILKKVLKSITEEVIFCKNFLILTYDFTKNKPCYIFSEVLTKVKDRKVLEKVSVASVSFIDYLKLWNYNTNYNTFVL